MNFDKRHMELLDDPAALDASAERVKNKVMTAFLLRRKMVFFSFKRLAVPLVLSAVLGLFAGAFTDLGLAEANAYELPVYDMIMETIDEE